MTEFQATHIDFACGASVSFATWAFILETAKAANGTTTCQCSRRPDSNDGQCGKSEESTRIRSRREVRGRDASPVTGSRYIPTSYPPVNKGVSASGHSKYLMKITLLM